VKEAKCPTCGKTAARRPANPDFPFCSHRCRLIDLGKWMDEVYRVPGRPEESDDDALPDRDPEQ
jgi:endogenous inhibitor of DNA gyrase (YacG/DUF329 family)